MSFARTTKLHIEGLTKYYLDRGKTVDGRNLKYQLEYLVRFMSSQRKHIASISEVGRKDIELYIDYLWNVEYGTSFKEGFLNRNNFVYRALRALRKFFEYLAIHEDEIDARLLPAPDLLRRGDFPNPHRRGSKHFPKWFDKFIHGKIIDLPEDNFHQLRFKTIMMVLYHMGARITDVLTLERGLFTEKHGFTWVRVFSNKTKFWYDVPVTLELKTYLEKYHEASEGLVREHPTTHQDANFLFWVEPQWIFKTFIIEMATRIKEFTALVREQAEEAGLPVQDIHHLSLTSHKFRHNVAIRLVRLGADPMLVAEFLGHKDLSMAQSYIQESEQEIDDLMDDLWGDDVLGLEDDLFEGDAHTKEKLFAISGVISKVDGGYCGHIGDKTPCGEDAYDCWQCGKLEPDYDDPGYPARLDEQLVEHMELKERNVHLGYFGAVKAEEAVIQRIHEFKNKLNTNGGC